VKLFKECFPSPGGSGAFFVYVKKSSAFWRIDFKIFEYVLDDIFSILEISRVEYPSRIRLRIVFSWFVRVSRNCSVSSWSVWLIAGIVSSIVQLSVSAGDSEMEIELLSGSRRRL